MALTAPYCIAGIGALAVVALLTNAPMSAGFQTMALKEQGKTCRPPRPPVEMASKAYIRNSYAAILEIIAAERQQQAGDCRCYLNEISWAEVVATSKRFETTDTPIPPFNLTKLRATAQSLATQQRAACGT